MSNDEYQMLVTSIEKEKRPTIIRKVHKLQRNKMSEELYDEFTEVCKERCRFLEDKRRKHNKK